MKNAIIIHGKSSKKSYFDPNIASPSNFGWIPWLQKQLLLNDILAQAPEMPKAYKPFYEEWREMVCVKALPLGADIEVSMTAEKS